MDIKDALQTIVSKRKIYFDDLLEESELAFMELEILVLMNEHHEKKTFTDIMRSKDYAKSHVSKAISNLVAKRYIEKTACENNKKVFYLQLLDKANYVLEEYYLIEAEYIAKAFEGISQSEAETFTNMLKKISANLES